MPGSAARFPWFDSLRGIAGLSMFGFHVAVALVQFGDNLPTRMMVGLSVGLDMFLVISGFLLYRPFAAARLAGRARPRFVPYAMRRVLRIVPAYWVALTLITIWLGLSGVFTVSGVPIYFGLVQLYGSSTIYGGIGQAWTICLEISFYAMLPLWVLLARRFDASTTRAFLRSELAGVALLILVGFTWTAVGLIGTDVQTDAVSPYFRVLPSFIGHFGVGMGIAALSVAVAARRSEPRAVAIISRASWLPWILAALVWLLAVDPLSLWTGHWKFDAFQRREAFMVVAGLMVLPAVFGDQRRGAVRRLLAQPWLLWVGMTSYGFYLWHVAVIDKVAGLAPDLGKPLTTLVALAGSLLAGGLSWYLLERRALEFGRGLSKPRDRGEAAAAEVAP